MKDRRRASLWSALRHRDFKLAISSLAVSQTGDWLYNIALIVFVLDATDSPAWVAAAGVVRLLPYVLFGTLGGVIADRYPRKVVMIVSDLLRAAVMLGLTAVAATSGSPTLALLLAAMSTTFAVAYSPCVNAAMPSIVGEQDLAAANTLSTTVTNLSYAVGPAVGGALLLLGSPTIAFAVNAGTFLVSALLTLPIRTDLGPHRGTLEEAVEREIDEEVGAPFLERFTIGIRALFGSADAVLVSVVYVASGVFFGAEVVVYALASSERLGMSNDGVALLYAAVGVGGIAGAGLANRAANATRQGSILVASAVVLGVPMMTLALIRSPAFALTLMVAEGAAAIVLDVVVITSLQRLLGSEVMGRAFGALDSVYVGGILLGSVLAPPTVRIAGLEWALVLIGGATLLAAALVLPRGRAIDRKAAERGRLLEPRVRVLSAIGIFGAAPPAAIESLAATVTEEQVGAGEVVIHQGDLPDDLFVVVSGGLRVTVRDDEGEREVARLGAADYFGEIGLLKRIPRTATVTATEPCDLLRLPGQDFVRIVNESGALAGNLRQNLQARLATHPAPRRVERESDGAAPPAPGV